MFTSVNTCWINMAEVLSQQEIDALLNGGASEAAKTEKIKIDK